MDSETYVLGLPPELYATIEEHAKKMGRSMAEEIWLVLHEYYRLTEVTAFIFGLALLADKLDDIAMCFLDWAF